MSTNIKASQEFVPFKEIRDGVVLMKNGGLRAILMASSVNLALKSSDEQNATLMQFQSFLNSLEFSVQISIQTKRLDIRPYLSTLDNRLKEEPNDLLRTQIKEYIEFIKSFTDLNDIMTKSFYVVIPYTPANISTEGFLDKLIPFLNKSGKKTKSEAFEEKKTQLAQRVSVVKQGLSRIGVKTAQLDTEQILELFFKTFNPGDPGSIEDMLK